MTDGVDQALAGAGLALLAADVGLTVHDGQVPNDAQPPYVLVYTAIEWVSAPSDALDGPARSPAVRWYCHCVGQTAAATRGIAQRVRTQLLNQRPVVPGLNVGLIRHESGPPPTRDESTGTVVFDAVNVYRLQATT